MRYLLLAAIIVLAGCPAHVHRGAWVTGQDGHGLNTSQPCQRSAEAVRAADLAIPIMWKLYEEHGHCTGYEDSAAWLHAHASVCLIDQPERGRGMAWPVHGFASMYNVVQSDRWPPICEPGMPAVLGCVKTKAEQKQGWERGYIHELTHLVLARCNIYDATHTHPAHKLEGEIWRRYEAAKGGP